MSFFEANAEFHIQKGITDAIWSGIATTEAGEASVEVDSAKKSELSPIQCYALSVAVQRAVSSIYTAVAAAKVRVFTSNGKEVTAGPLLTLLKRPRRKTSWRKFCETWVAWKLIAGEHAFAKEAGLTSLRILNPYRLHIETPANRNVETREEIVKWRYNNRKGDPEYIADSDIVFEANFNPFLYENVRGMSPLMAGATQAGIEWFAGRYNKTALENDMIPQGMLVLPDGTPRKDRLDFQKRFFSEFGSNKYRQNYRSMMVVSGKDVHFEPFEQPMKDAHFLDAQRWASEVIGRLYNCPPIVMHNLEKTRFDTADYELRMFHENTIAPLAEDCTETLQIQLVDPHFRRAGHTVSDGMVSKSLQKAFEKRRAIADGELVILIDTDTIPTMNSVKAVQIETAKAFRETTFASPAATNRYFNIELDDSENDELRNDIWIPNSYVNISNPQMNAALVPGTKPGGDEKRPADEKKPKPEKHVTDADKLAVKHLTRIVRELRVMSLDAVDRGWMWTLEEARDMAAGYAGEISETIRRVISNDYLVVKRYLTDEDLSLDDRKTLVKEHFNTRTKHWIRTTLGL